MRDGGESSAAKWNWGRARASARKSVLPGARRVFPAHLTSAAPWLDSDLGQGHHLSCALPHQALCTGGGEGVAESLMLMVFAQILQGCRGFIQPWGEQTTSLQPKKPFPARLREGTTAPLGSSEHTPGHVISEAALWQR